MRSHLNANILKLEMGGKMQKMRAASKLLDANCSEWGGKRGRCGDLEAKKN